MSVAPFLYAWKGGECVGYNVKSVRDSFKKSGIFYTPRPLAEYMRSFLPEKITDTSAHRRHRAVRAGRGV